MICLFIPYTASYHRIFVARARLTIPVVSHIKSLISSIKQRHGSHFAPKDEDDFFVGLLQEKLNCSKEDAVQISFKYPKLLNTKSADAKRNLELLLAKGVQASVILDNPEMLLHSHDKLRSTLNILIEMKPRNINDFAPLAATSSTQKLMKIKNIAKIEEDVVPQKHRIYQMSEAMNVEPHIVAKFVSNRLFVLDGHFDHFNKKLQILLKYIAPFDILRDLWAFQYSPRVMENRLSRARKGNLKKLMPWLIRCPEKTFLISLELVANKKAAVGEKTLVAYLSERLKCDEETTEAIIKKHPSLYKVNEARVKTVLDYLLDDAGFTEEQIARTPKILCCLSLQTLKQRINELKSLDCRPATLSTVCQSDIVYKKFVENVKKRNQFNHSKS